MELDTSELESAEKAAHHIVDLLTQVDQGLNEAKVQIERFYENARHIKQSDEVGAALKNVDAVLAQMISQHNILVGELRAFREQAASAD